MKKILFLFFALLLCACSPTKEYITVTVYPEMSEIRLPDKPVYQNCSLVASSDVYIGYTKEGFLCMLSNESTKSLYIKSLESTIKIKNKEISDLNKLNKIKEKEVK